MARKWLCLSSLDRGEHREERLSLVLVVAGKRATVSLPGLACPTSAYRSRSGRTSPCSPARGPPRSVSARPPEPRPDHAPSFGREQRELHAIRRANAYVAVAPRRPHLRRHLLRARSPEP